MRRLLRIAFILSTLPFSSALSQPNIDVPLVELPYNVQHGIRTPGMEQSLALTADFYELAHTALGRISPRHKLLTNIAITLFDYFTAAVPFADAWVHEEWHRAILGRRGIDSKNDVWNVRNIFAEAISVSHVTDEDLIRLKRDHPVDFARTKSAGIEGELQLVTHLETQRFFNGTKTFHAGLYWLIALNTQLYVGAVVSPEDSAEIDDLTTEANLEERTIAERDISGHDFTSWVYHLFRRAQPLEARGEHPSGVGLDRYIKVSDLTEEEKRYLERQGKLMWLNLVDPNLLGKEFSFDGGSKRANVWLRHMLTSFGHVTQAHVVYASADTRLHVTGQRYENHDRSFPGLQVEAVRIPLKVSARRLAVSPRVGVWSQPEDQLFITTGSTLGGLAGARVETATGQRLSYYIDAELKSDGWVVGRPSLQRTGTLRAGLTYALNR